VVRLLLRLDENVQSSFPFLAMYRENLTGVDWEQQIAAYTSDDYLPIPALQDHFSPDAVWVLLTAGLIEEDIRFGALFAALQDPLLSRRPCIGLLGWLLEDIDVLETVRPLIESGLLVVDNPQEARAEWVLRVPPVIWDALRGNPPPTPAPGMSLQPTDTFPDLHALILPPDLQRQVTRVPHLLNAGQITTLVLRGMTGSGRRTTIGSVARALERSVLLCDLEQCKDEAQRLIGPLATLSGAVPVLRCNPGPGTTLDVPTLAGYRGPVGMTLGRGGGLRGPLLTHALTLNLPPPDHHARTRFWQAAGVPVTATLQDELARRFLLTGGLIHRAAHLGHAYVLLDNRDSLTSADVQEAMRALNRQSLDTLATRLEPVTGWSDLVVSKLVGQELGALETRCRARESLREQAGRAFTRNLNRGVRAMFSGPSGTGKTLAARVLAAVLQMDLYRVDLSAVVNKYIGETERNLNEVFSRAEELDVILLLDEGDALMTQRTDVQSSNDRYANLETNYLLQRMEQYEGIVIVTTNAGKRIDNAFLRRLDVIVDFALPDAAERRALWHSHLPEQHMIEPTLLEAVIQRCALSGGQIRNAALYATLLALQSTHGMHDVHLKEALRREYRKAGAAYPLHDRAAAPTQLERLRQFTHGLEER
jgi:AAA+ superfamily predicted ATPase